MLLLPLLLPHLCSHSPVLICCLLSFPHSHLPAPIPLLSSACSCLRSLTLPHSYLPALVHVHVPSRVCLHSRSCAFAGSHLPVRVCTPLFVFGGVVATCCPAAVVATVCCCHSSVPSPLPYLLCTLSRSYVISTLPPLFVPCVYPPSSVLTSLVPTHPCLSLPTLVHAAHAFVCTGTLLCAVVLTLVVIRTRSCSAQVRSCWHLVVCDHPDSC